MKRAFVAFVLYGGLTIALTYPLILQLGSAFPHDAGDPALNTWLLWWNAHTMPYTTAWWNAPFFYPVTGALAFSEHLLGLSLIATPIQWLGFAPTVAYNAVFLITFPLCAIGAYLLGREATGRDDAAFIAGVLYGFAPYRIAQMAHIQMLAAFGMPFALVGLHRYIRELRWPWLVLFAVGWFLQALCNGYFLVFFGFFVGLWLLWFVPPWREGKTFATIVATWFVASLPLVPLLWQYQVIHQRFRFAREFGTMVFFGADLMALLNAAPSLALWGHLHVFMRPEGELFPGITIVVILLAGLLLMWKQPISIPHSTRWWWARAALVLVAVVPALIAASIYIIGPWELKRHRQVVFSVANPMKPLTYVLVSGIVLTLTSARVRDALSKRSVLGFYAVAAFVTWLLSLGPSPSLMGETFMYRGPYALLMYLPGFNALRVPTRFWMMTVLCFSVIGAMIFAKLTERPGWTRGVVAALVALGVLADGWVSAFPLVNPPPIWKAEACGNETRSRRGALLELPAGRILDDVAAMYRSTSHGRPVVNGYSGNFPPHYMALRFALGLREDDILTELAAHGTSHIVINAANDRDGRLRQFVSQHRGVELVCTEGQQTLYRLGEEKATQSVAQGHSLPAKMILPNVNPESIEKMTDGDLKTRWESGPQTEGTWVMLDFGAPSAIGSVELMLGPYFEDFPRALAIEASDDGMHWREVWRGGSAGFAFRGALEEPSVVPLRFALPPTTSRYLRLRLLSNDETYYWTIAELKVYGPS
jgi:hypothetical protein